MSHNKIYSLQVYRAIAAVMVVLFHMTDLSQRRFGQPFVGNIFSFGYVGVDFFFVLSGFIILYVHGNDIGRAQQIKEYITKRFIRLYPIYWFVASVKIFIIFLIPSLAKSHETDLGYIIKSLLLIPQEFLPIIGAAWTLSYEVLFYLLFGLAIFIGGRWALKLAIIWTIAIINVLIFKTIGEPIFGTNIFVNFLLNERNLEFILGCLAAYIVLNVKVKYGKLIAVVGGLIFLYFSWYVVQGSNVPSFTFTFGLASFLLVVGSSSIEIQKAVKWPKVLVFLGDASYSIYLTHVIFFNAFMVAISKFDLLPYIGPFFASIIMVCFAIIGGSLVYLLIEKSLMLNLRRKFVKPKVIEPFISPNEMEAVGSMRVE